MPEYEYRTVTFRRDASRGEMMTMRPLTMKAPTTSLNVALHVAEEEGVPVEEDEDEDEEALQVELEAQLLVCKSSFQPL